MAGLGLNAAADLQAEIGSKLDAIQQVGYTQLRVGWRKYAALSGGITGIGSQTVATTLIGPEAGRQWQVHRLTFGTVTPGALVATPGTIVIGKGTGVQTQSQSSGQVIAGSSSQFIEVERSTTVPGQFTWGRNQFVLVYPMNLIVFWVSGTAMALTIDGDAYEYVSETAQPGPG